MDGDMDLCAASLFGDIDKIGEILKTGADPNARDTNGRTPLLYAVREGRTEIVYLLLKNGADPNAKDTNERTPLLYAVREGRTEALHLLLKNGADPNAKDTDGRTPLLYAAQEERTESLHLLLKNGADPNTKDTDGRTPLLYAAEKGRTEAVYLLLKNGADPNIASKLGITARYVALYRGNNYIVKIFDNPPAHVEKEVTKYPRMQVKQKEPQENNIKRLGICKHFQSYVRYFGKSRVSAFSTVYDIVYSHRLEKFSRPQQPQQQSATETSNETIRWLHLPVVNRVWVKDLIKKLCAIDGKTEEQCKGIEQFIDDTFAPLKRSIPRSRFRNITFPQGSLDKASFVMSYIDMESTMRLNTEDSDITGDNPIQTNFRQMGAVQDEYELSHLDIAQTLDRSYYEGLDHITLDDRDKNQVVSRYIKSQKQKGENNQTTAEEPHDSMANLQQSSDIPGVRKPYALDEGLRKLKESSKLLMVKQLWLWKIDDRTIITAFPQRWDITNDNYTLLHKILDNSSWHRQIQSAEDLIVHIFHRCTEFIYEPFNAGLEESLFYIFSSHISTISAGVTECYGLFGPVEIGIEKEMGYLKDIQDVLDELNMIEVILVQQKNVTGKIRGWLYKKQNGGDGEIEKGDTGDLCESKDQDKIDESKNGAPNGGKSQNYWNNFIDSDSVNSSCQHVERLKADARRVEKMLNHLLDLKQKQANLEEARSAKKEAADTARQGNFILAFTVVTVIFTPLSFAAAYLAIPNTSGTSRIAQIMGIAEGATLAVVPVLVYLTWADHIGAKK